MSEAVPLPDYKSLLARAKKELPEPTSTGERWEIPSAEVMTEGRTTVLRNFAEILQKLRRERNHLLPYLLREIGTAGDSDGDRVIFQGNIPTKSIQERINTYAKTYVICGECGRPDTHLTKEERTTLLKCEACGAHKPIAARVAKAPPKPEAALVEGKVYEMFVQEISQRGDGVAKHEGFTIFIPGGRKGAQVRVLVEKISGNVAFGRIQP